MNTDEAPTVPGLYRVAIYYPTNLSPYRTSEREDRDLVVRYAPEGVDIWTVGGWVSCPDFSAFMATEHPGRKAYWYGPQKFHRLCFKCDKPIFPVGLIDDPEDPLNKYVLQCSGAVDLRTCGHYGSTFIDSMGDEQISVLICDDCLRKHGEKVLWMDISRVDKSRYNYHTQKESVDRSKEFRKEEIRLMEAAGFEWRDYSADFLPPSTPYDIDCNNCGWYPKEWQPCREVTVYKDGSRGYVKDYSKRYDYPEALQQALEVLRDRIFRPSVTAEFIQAEERRQREDSGITPEFAEQLRKSLERSDEHVDVEATGKANLERE